MLPIRDNAPSRTIPWVILAIVVLNSVMLCVQAWPGIDGGALVGTYGLVPARFTRWSSLGGVLIDPRRYVPIFTSMFLHDGWLHLATNMVYLWTFGRALEDRLGRVGVAATFGLSGVAAALGQLIAHPHSNAAMVGASGAIAGVLGAYLVCFPRATVTLAFPFFLVPWVLRVRAMWFLIAWFAIQVGKGIGDVLSHTTEPQVAWWAHAAGFVAGLAGAIAGRAWQEEWQPSRPALPMNTASSSFGRNSLAPWRPSTVPAVAARTSRVP